MLIQFFKENIVCDFFLALALLSWFITIGARIESKKTGRFVSGVPAVGGICVIIGFLLSSAKWFALLGFLDPDLIYLITVVIPEYRRYEKAMRNQVPQDANSEQPAEDSDPDANSQQATQDSEPEA